ncbi:MAG: TetR/AcrR family transcriptional regulator [Pseudomonadota bacterium]
MSDNFDFKNEHQLDSEAKNRINHAVRELFSIHDFHQVTMRTIAKKARVGLNTIYKLYDSKEQMLFDLIDEWLHDLMERTKDHLQGMEDIQERLRKIFYITLEYYEKNPDVAQIIFFTVPLKTWITDKSYRQKRIMDVYLQVLKEGQEKGVLDPSVPARYLLDIINGMIGRIFLMWTYRPYEQPPTVQAKLFFDLIWRAISNPKNQGEPTEAYMGFFKK